MPAIWLLPRQYPYGRDGRSGELDIGEVVTSRPAEVLGSAYWSHDQCGWGCSKYADVFHLPGADAASAFHTYRLEWTPRSLKWFVDGVGYYELGDAAKYKWASQAENPPQDAPIYPAPFDETNPMYLILNLAVGGNTPGPPNSATPFPAAMDVQYARVYRQTGS
jgi:beta-glucanase (GH16 family)